MDVFESSWSENDWDTPTEEPSWHDDIESAIHEASVVPNDLSIPDPLGTDTEVVSEDTFSQAEPRHESILDAIEEASSIPSGSLSGESSTDMVDDPFGHCIQGPLPGTDVVDDPLGHCIQGPLPGIEMPLGSDLLLLDLLPVAPISIGDDGKAHVEIEGADMTMWPDAKREVAEHLVSWLEETGDTRNAVEHAVRSGMARLEALGRQYDELLEEADYDRSDPTVQACADSFEQLHSRIEYAKEVLRTGK